MGKAASPVAPEQAQAVAALRAVQKIFERDVTFVGGGPDAHVRVPFESHDQSWNHWHEAREIIRTALAASPEAAPAAMDAQRPVTVEEDAALRNAARSSSEVVARGRLAATPAAPSAVTDEQIIRAAYQHLSTWDEDHIRFARAVLALAQPAPVQQDAPALSMVGDAKGGA